MTQHDQSNRNFGVAALWASAFVIAAMIITSAARLPINPAFAGDVSSAGDYTILTAASGGGNDIERDELLYIIDNRDGTLLVYEVEDVRNKRIFVRDGGSLASIFNTAR